MSNEERKWYIALRVRTKTGQVFMLHTITDPNPTQADGVMVIPLLDAPMTYKEACEQITSGWWAWVGPLVQDEHGPRRARA